MNLLALMLEGKVVWPAAAGFAAQDKSDYIVHFYRVEPDPVKYLEWRLSENEGVWTKRPKHPLSGLASDWDTHVVTKEEYQAAGGWIGWEGGNCPVPKEAPILYTTKVLTAEPARAGACSWDHVGDDSDILAYCLTAIIPGCSSNDAAEALTRIYAKLGVTTLEEAFAKIDEGAAASVRHTIVHGPDTFKNCTILLKSRQTIVWGHNGKEYISPIMDVLIDPSQDERVAYLLTGLCKAQVTPAHVQQVREQVCWVYPENQ